VKIYSQFISPLFG